MKKVLFIHRSVGKNLINDGNMRALSQGKFDLSDYDHNTKVLTTSDGQQQDIGIEFFGGDTKPADLAQLFSRSGQEEQIGAHQMIFAHDIIIIKSCYPNSNIASDEDLKQLKEDYTNIFKFFLKYKDKQLILLTSPPLKPGKTSKVNARRAQDLNSWLTNIGFGVNISVFDFFGLLADDKGILKREYRRATPLDSHPNKRASSKITPMLIEHIARIAR